MHREDGEARAVEGEVADAAALVEGAVGVEDAAREENGPRDVEHEAAHAERVREDDDGAEDAAGDEHWVLGVQVGGNKTQVSANPQQLRPALLCLYHSPFPVMIKISFPMKYASRQATPGLAE